MKIRLLIFLICLGSGSLFGQGAMDTCMVEFTVENDSIICNNKAEVIQVQCTNCDNTNTPSFNWIYPDGTPKQNLSEIDAIIDGTYTVEVENGGCKSLDYKIEIKELNLKAIAGPDTTFSCVDETVILGGQVESSPNTGFDISWIANRGNIVENGNTATPTINSPGEYVMTVSTDNCTHSDVVTISEKINYNLELSEIQNATCDNNDGSIKVDVTENNSLLFDIEVGDVKFEDISLPHTISELSKGGYQIKIIDENGCSSNQEDIIVESSVSNIVADAGLEQEITCATTSVQIGTDMPDSQITEFSWTRDEMPYPTNEINPTVTEPGIYTLTVKDANGCSDSDDVVVTPNNNEPMADAAGQENKITCRNDIITLGGTNTSSGTNFTYLWTTENGSIISGTENTENARVDAGGTYNLMVNNNDNGCISESSVVIAVDIMKPIAQVTPGKITLICTQRETSLTNNLNEETDLSFSWFQNGEGFSSNSTTSTNEEGNYRLIVTNTQNGCSSDSSDIISIEVDTTLPSITINPITEMISCKNDKVEITANVEGGDDFSWSPNGNILNGENENTVTVNAPGTYTLTVLNTTNGCREKEDIDIVGSMDMPMITIDVLKELNCIIDVVSIGSGAQGNLDFNFEWRKKGDISIISENLVHEVSDSGTYILTVINPQNDCKSTETVKVTMDRDLPNLQSKIDIITPPCEGETTNFSLPLNLDVNWTDGRDGNDREVELIGGQSYSFEVTNQKNLCSNDTTFKVPSIPKPKPDDDLGIYLLIPGDLLFIPNETFHYRWGWMDDNGPQYYDESPTERTYLKVDNFKSLKEERDFFVEIYNPNTQACSVMRDYNDGTPNGLISHEEEEQRIIYNEDYFNSLSQTLGKQDKINAYPNPTSGLFNIELYGDYRGMIEVVVYNEIGKRIIKDQLYKEAPYLIRPIDFSKYRNGIYLIHLIDEQGEISTIKTLVNH